MFAKSLLFLSALVFLPANGMTAPEFLDGCCDLIRSVRNQTGLSNDSKSNFETRWETIRSNLNGAVCDGCVVDYSRDTDAEIARLVEDKSRSLGGQAVQLFEELRQSLQSRKDLQDGKWFFPSGEVKTERKNLGDMLVNLKKLNDFLNGIGLRGIIADRFQEARVDGRLRGSDRLQEWFAFFKDSRDGCFSEYLMSSFNRRALELGPSMRSTVRLTEDMQRRIAEWDVQFQTMRSLSFPTEPLYDSLLDRNGLMPFLDGISEGWRGRVADQWLDSLERGSRCKFFIPAVSVDNIERFFSRSGGTSYTKSIRSLLECGSVGILRQTLWGAPIENANTPKGLILNALLARTNHREPRSYQNATLIITDLEELTRADIAHREYVINIWDFLKFITADELAAEGELYRFPYLGIENGNQEAGRVNLGRFNVVLSTPTESFVRICRGVSRFVGGRSAAALERRMSLIARQEDTEDIDEENIMYEEMTRSGPSSRQGSRRNSIIEEN